MRFLLPLFSGNLVASISQFSHGLLIIVVNSFIFAASSFE